jgi:hypothetical protein
MTCLWVILALFSCSKENDFTPPPSPPPIGSLSFSINGTTFNWKEERNTASSNFLDIAIYPDWSGYILNASTLNPNLPYRFVNLPIQTPTLGVNTPFTFLNNGNRPNLAVAISTAPTPYVDPSVDYRAYLGDQVTVNITKIQDKRASGTFSANLTRGSDSSKVNITEGRFVNIRITQ